MFEQKPMFCYCYFCGGPLRDAYKTWKYRWLPEIWPTISEKPHLLCTGFFPEIENKSIDELVCITEEDGRYWEDGTVISRLWSDTGFVCPTSVKFPYAATREREPVVLGNNEWTSAKKAEPFLTIHRMCLSYICRRLKITPHKLWCAIFPKPRPAWLSKEYTLIRYNDYMDGRYDGYNFDYAMRHPYRDEDGNERYNFWTPTMKDCAWLLAHPSVFPKLEPAKPSQTHFSQPSQAQPSALFRVLSISELFSHIISFLRSPPPDSLDNIRPIIHQSMLSAYTKLLRTCQGLHNLLRHQQSVYFDIVRDSGWMLPTTPADWAGWKAVGNPTPIRVGQLDWRAYLETFVWYEDDRHVRNRWRLESMAAQFALPTRPEYVDEGGRSSESPEWSVGEYGRPSRLTEPTMFTWEVPPERVEEDDTEDDTSEWSE
ncbi:hypothetical protein BC834DRAFT_966721 [Gloeopeniophorella convolvens]|nr:hypothetical protein BC834DRAFT_966721 [Gloeopeniophorella convolvens]